jgi:transposase
MSELLPVKIGRPSKAEQVLTPDVIEAVGQLLMEGNYQETVCDFLGIHRTTWYAWIQRGDREPGTLFSDFSYTVKKAQAAAEIVTLRLIRQGGEGWQSKAWIAERRFPQRWGKRIDITIRQEAERLAAEVGCTADDLIADAERIASGAGF